MKRPPEYPDAPLKDEYYNHVLDKEDFGLAKNIVYDILNDLTGRRGLRQEWEGIDDYIQNSIIQKWIDITKKHIGN